VFKLTRFPETRYTMMESHLFDVLPKNGRKIDSAAIVKLREEMGDWDVKFPMKNITVTMQRLIDKIEANGEPFQIVKDGKRTGHHKVQYWIEPRKPARKKANGR
jgi:hypothetical protein